MSDVQKAGVSVTPKTGQCDKSIDSTSISNITAETFNKILMTVSKVAKVNFDNRELIRLVYRLQNISKEKHKRRIYINSHSFYLFHVLEIGQ